MTLTLDQIIEAFEAAAENDELRKTFTDWFWSRVLTDMHITKEQALALANGTAVVVPVEAERERYVLLLRAMANLKEAEGDNLVPKNVGFEFRREAENLRDAANVIAGNSPYTPEYDAAIAAEAARLRAETKTSPG